MNLPFANHYARRNGDIWPNASHAGCAYVSCSGWLVVSGPATRRCSQEPEAIDLVNVPVEAIDLIDDDLSTGTAVIDLMDRDFFL
jgi:hypothetical protein